MDYIISTFQNLASQTAFATLDPKNYVMIAVALFFLWLAIAKGFEPLLLVPISFGMLLSNMFPSIIAEGGLFHFFYLLDEWSILPSLIFLGVGAMTDFDRQPKELFAGCGGSVRNLCGLFSGNPHGL